MTELIHQEAFCFFKAVAFDELNKHNLSVPAGARQESLKVFILSSFSVRKIHMQKKQNNLNQMRQCLRQEHEPCKGFVLYKQAKKKKDASFPSLNLEETLNKQKCRNQGLILEDYFKMQ